VTRSLLTTPWPKAKARAIDQDHPSGFVGLHRTAGGTPAPASPRGRRTGRPAAARTTALLAARELRMDLAPPTSERPVTGISSEERIMRGAAALYYSADERSKGVRRLPPERFDQRAYIHMLDSCTKERNDVQKLITDAGLTFGYSRDGKAETRLELESSETSGHGTWWP